MPSANADAIGLLSLAGLVRTFAAYEVWTLVYLPTSRVMMIGAAVALIVGVGRNPGRNLGVRSLSLAKKPERLQELTIRG